VSRSKTEQMLKVYADYMVGNRQRMTDARRDVATSILSALLAAKGSGVVLPHLVAQVMVETGASQATVRRVVKEMEAAAVIDAAMGESIVTLA